MARMKTAGVGASGGPEWASGPDVCLACVGLAIGHAPSEALFIIGFDDGKSTLRLLCSRLVMEGARTYWLRFKYVVSL